MPTPAAPAERPDLGRAPHACRSDTRAKPIRPRLRRDRHHLTGGFVSRHINWKLDPLLLRLTPSRLAPTLVFPTGLLETRGARTGETRRNAIIYFHNGDHDRRIQRQSTTPGLVPQPSSTPRRHVRRNTDSRSRRRRRDRTRIDCGTLPTESFRPTPHADTTRPRQIEQSRSSNPHPARRCPVSEPASTTWQMWRAAPHDARTQISFEFACAASPADCRPLEHSRTTAPNCPPPMGRHMPLWTPDRIEAYDLADYN